MTDELACKKCGAASDERFDCCEVFALTKPASDADVAFREACDEAGCAYDNEALLQSIAKLKQENSLLKSQFRNCHIEIANLRNALLSAGVSHS